MIDETLANFRKFLLGSLDSLRQPSRWEWATARVTSKI